jgi:hypothetical protein
VTQKQFKKKTTSVASDRAKLVAPAPGRMLAGVVLLCSLGLLASSALPADWMAVAGCIIVLTSGALILEYSGRAVAERHPHPLYLRGRLPSDSPRLKTGVVVATLAVLVAVTSLTVPPEGFVSPFPFFVTAEFLFLVLPQLLARRAIRNYDRAHDPARSAQEGGNAPRKRKRKKSKHKNS